MKSERLKKLENELTDLQRWLNLGLVPKKDLERHNKEINALQVKINEEKERLAYIKESGDDEEYTMPRRSPQAKQPFQDGPTMSDVSTASSDSTESGLDLEATSYTDHSTLFDLEESGEEKTKHEDEEEEENPFSDKNRWRRGILEDPDANDW